MQINPTRYNLLLLKRRLAIAEKGRDILSRKRQALAAEFLKLLNEPRKRRHELEALLQKAYEAVIVANSYVGNYELTKIAYYMNKASPVNVDIKNIMGVKVPEIKIVKYQPAETPFSAGLAVDEISKEFSTVLQAFVDTAAVEHGLKVTVLEIEKVNRQINTLDNAVIPSIRQNEKYIQMRIDEMERDMFVSLKHVKKRLEKGKVNE